MRTLNLLILALLASAIIISCSGNSSPSLPAQDLPASQEKISSFGRICWGHWDIFIDKQSGAVEIVPLRGVNFQVNIVNFLQPPAAPINLLTIQIGSDSDFPSGKINCNVSIKHPFPGTKFCGFDVQGIVMDDWAPSNLVSDPSIILSMPPETLLRNADGWTRWWNQAEFTSYGTLFGYIEGSKANHNWVSTHTLNAFKYFADGIGPADEFNPDPLKRGFFSSESPGTNVRRYELQFPLNPNPVFRFKYAISASWVAPFAGATAPYTADDFPIEANMPEAYWIGIIDNGSTAYYESPSKLGGDLNLLVEVRDWQFSGNPNSIMDEISEVLIESPIFTSSPVALDLSLAQSVPDNQTAVRIPVEIKDVKPNGVQNQPLVIIVKSAHPTTYEPQIPGISGYKYPEGHLAAYNIVYAPISDVGPENQPPVADASKSNPLTGKAPLMVNLDPTLSYDPDGSLVLYEWDFETDGIYDTSSPTPDIVPHSFDKGSYKVTLRVTDNEGASDTDEINVKATGPEISGWPMAHQDLKRRGARDVPGPKSAVLKYNFSVTSPIFSAIVLDKKDRAIFRANNGNLYCVNPNGTLAWSYFIGGTYDYGGACVASDDSIFIGNSLGQLYHISSEGSLMWSMDTKYGNISCGLAIMEDDSILLGSFGGYIAKIGYDQSIKWEYYTGFQMADGPAVNDDGMIYQTDKGGFVRALDKDGNQIWVKGGFDIIYACPTLGDNAMYFGDNSGSIYCLDYDGNIIWSGKYGNDTINSMVALGPEGKIYVGCQDDKLYCLWADTGELAWATPVADGIGSSSPVLDCNGRVYVGCYSGDFYCMNIDDGSILWNYSTGATIFCRSPAITSNGTVITGTNGKGLFAFRD